jgi:aspartate racemase
METKIGIVGGMGPLAGIQLFLEILNETKAATDNDHKSVVLLSYPSEIPSRPKFLSGEISENPGITISKILKELDLLKVSTVGIPCISAHGRQIFSLVENEVVQNNYSFKLYNLLEETSKYIKKNYNEEVKVGILGTKETLVYRLFDNSLNSEGITNLVYPSEESMDNLLTPIIFNEEYGVKSSGSEIRREAQELFNELIYSEDLKDTDIIVLGCTELSLVASSLGKNSKFVDPLKVLANCLVNHKTKLL